MSEPHHTSEHTKVVDPLIGYRLFGLMGPGGQDGYRIQDLIGYGGMGAVYKALDIGLDKVVALKHLDPQKVPDETHVKRFYREARVLARIRNEHIVEVYALRETDRGLFIAMEYVEGQTLADWVQQQKPTWRDLLPIIDQILDALDQAHRNHIIHRDIKPKNIMITPQGVVKIVDFGLAKLEEGTRLTQSGTTVGTEAYMSPEQIRGEALDARADLWSLGVMLYEFLAGRHPWVGTSFYIFAILNEEPRPLSVVCPGVPELLGQIVRRCMQKEADQRFQSAGDMRVVFNAFRESAGA